MRDRIELGKRQVQQSQWGSKYALNRDDSYEHTVGSALPFQLWNNHPNLTTQPQPQPSMSTSSLEQAILKISKVMEDFVGEQQKINSHLNEKIDNLESSINVRMEGVYNDLSLRIEKVQDSIEKLTNLDIARGKRKLPPQPHHNLQGTNEKIKESVEDRHFGGDCYDNSMNQPSIENHKVQNDKGEEKRNEFLGPNEKDANFGKQERKAKAEQLHHSILATVGHILITSRSSFHVYFILYQILGSQESISLNVNGNVVTAPHFALVGHVFGALSRAQIMNTISSSSLPSQSQAFEPHFFAPLCLRPNEAMPHYPSSREPHTPWDHTHEASHSISDLLKPSKPIENTKTEAKVLIQPTQKATTDASAPQDLTII
ncbi:hypothetical protein AAG906_003059 [Vitis piasezkii]